MSDWKNVPVDIKEYQGFVYKITNCKTGRYYIGKKFFWSKKSRPPLKGRKNKRRYVVESDWKSYWGSSPVLKADVEKYGVDSFERSILKCCFSKFDCAYEELWYQVELGVLFDPQSYNEIINVRLRRRKE